MRISDWSSDVCSSDLGTGALRRGGKLDGSGAPALGRPPRSAGNLFGQDGRVGRWKSCLRPGRSSARSCWSRRSEEHTSELQSLMRISYAVFCLQKKIEKKEIYTPTRRNNNKDNVTTRYAELTLKLKFTCSG